MENKNLISFDIFDTLIARKCLYPNGIFKIMEVILNNQEEYANLPQLLREDFAFIRQESESFTRESCKLLYKKEEISIFDIYKIIQINYNLSDKQTEKLINLEINTEKNNLYGIEKNINKLKKYLNDGHEVMIISDIYYSEKILHSFLDDIDSVFKNIKIYSSLDYNSTKRNGHLYKLIRQDFPNYKNWTHIGDNFLSDVLRAKQNNIKTIQTSNIQLDKKERFLLNELNYNYKIKSIIGCINKLKLSNNNNNKYLFGVSFAAPILYNYVYWMLQQCCKLNISDIYFVARDGYILQKIAEIINEKLKLNLNCHYFYASRTASRIITSKNYNHFIEAECYCNKTLLTTLNHINISVQDLEKFLQLDIKTINKKGTKFLIDSFVRNNELKTYILNKNQEKLDIFKKYLLQEIPINIKKVAFIDVNGTGRTQDIISEILYDINHCISYNYFLHYDPITKQFPFSIKSQYITSVRYTDDWIELLCRCKDGQTLYYEENNDRIVPIKENISINNMENWGYDEYLKGVVDYTKEMVEFEIANKIQTNTIKYYCAMIKYVDKLLSKQDADIIGTIPFTSVGLEKGAIYAPKITLLNLFKFKVQDYISLARCSWYNKWFYSIFKKFLNPKNYIFFLRHRKIAYIKIFGIKIQIGQFVWK